MLSYLNQLNPFTSSRKGLSADEALQKASNIVEEKGQNLVKQVSSFYDNPTFTSTGFRKYYKQGWKKNSLMFSAIDYYKKALGQSSLVVKDGDDGDAILEQHPLTNLFDDPNEFQNERKLIDVMIDHWFLSGNVYLPIAMDNKRDPAEIVPVMPSNMKIAKHPYDWIDHYKHEIAEEDIRIEKERVVHFRYQNPTDFAVGISPITAAFSQIDTDNELTNHVKKLLENSAVPGMVLKVAENLITDEQARENMVDRFKQKFGGKRKGDPGVIGREDEIEQVGFDLDQMAFPDLAVIEETRILSVLGVSPILLNTTAGLDRSVFENKQQARKEFWLDSAFDLQDRFAKGFTDQLLSLFGNENENEFYVGWDNSDVSAVNSIEREKKDQVLKEWKAGLITINEYRNRFDMEPVDDERGDMFKTEIGAMRAQAMKEQEDEGEMEEDGGGDQNEPPQQQGQKGRGQRIPTVGQNGKILGPNGNGHH